ncbi:MULTISPECIES: tetratricopeptide repeat protein [Leptolyngbya]|uniref:tetratricopeptide repeat protein n=1 Tax=Leptolyngbya TaxID=47251 RepID=UPI001688D052|nr:hypothetical protein [Leptolyngbya sp. FACHB-1624]MBD1856722.1 hypothetical protein [Leptolyngbya sp. FACHB-1624]
MMKRLAKDSFRIFPLIQAELYAASDKIAQTSDQQAAQNLLSLANQPFNHAERLFGWQLNAKGQVGHLLMQHRQAIAAELAGQWERADFFWNQVQIEFKAIAGAQLWQQIATEIAASKFEIMSDPQQVQQRLVDEIMIDTHCAFYNGWQQTEQLQDRAFAHIEYIEHWLPWSSINESAQALLEQPWKMQIQQCLEIQHWQQAIGICKRRLKHCPDVLEYQAELAAVHYSATMARLKSARSDAQYLRNAEKIQRGIKTLEALLKTYPCNLGIFELLGDLFHLKAIALGNGGRVAEALVSVQTAISYNPRQAAFYSTSETLIEQMQAMQTRFQTLCAEMAGQSNVSLNAAGVRLQAEVRQGFQPMNDYCNSSAAKTTAFAFSIAQAVQVWQMIGLPNPPNGWKLEIDRPPDHENEDLSQFAKGWNQLALQLWKALMVVLHQSPPNQNILTETWDSIVLREPALGGLNSKLIQQFLAARLWGEESNRVIVSPIPEGDAPILQPIASKRRRSIEPFLPWLCSRQDQRIKLQAIAASLAVIVAGGVIVREQGVNAVRDMAYQQILSAYQQQNDQQVIQQAEQFFDHASLSGKDARNQKVIDIYSESLVRWIAQQEKPDQTLQQRLDRYRTRMNTNKGDESP